MTTALSNVKLFGTDLAVSLEASRIDRTQQTHLSTEPGDLQLGDDLHVLMWSP
jgi:hypothetical protein